MINRTTQLLVLPPLLALASAAVVVVLDRPLLASTHTIQPFYLEQTRWAETADGSFQPERTKTIARRSDGVTVVITGVGPAFAGRMRKVIDPAGQASTVWDNVQLKTTWPPSDEDAVDLGARLKSSSTDCRPGESTIENGQADGFLRFEAIEDQKVAVIWRNLPRLVLTEWRAPGLACEVLRSTSWRTGLDGAGRLTAETTTTRIDLGEPAPELFAIDAAESKPSVGLIALLRWSNGGSLPPADEIDLRREGAILDDYYRSGAPAKR